MKKAISIILLLCIYAELLTACDPAVPITDEYTEKQDCQYMYGSSMEFRMCASEDSYYYLAPTGTIYLIDKQTLQCVPFCSKPNCSHDNSACTARTQSKGIWFYQDALYVTDPREDVTTETNELETYGLYRLSLDGTTKDLVRPVGSSILGGFIHRGYYYANDFDGIRRYSLSDQESSELIFENEKDRQYTVRNAYANAIYLHVTNTASQPVIEELQVHLDDLSHVTSIGYIETKDKKTEGLLSQSITSEGVFSKKTVADSLSETIYESSFLWIDDNTNESKPIDFLTKGVDTAVMSGIAVVDSSYYYYFATPGLRVGQEIFEQSRFLIYDRKTAKKLEELPFNKEYGDLYSALIGDDRYLFMEFEPSFYYDENAERVKTSDVYRSLCVLDKQSIGKSASIRELIRVTP